MTNYHSTNHHRRDMHVPLEEFGYITLGRTIVPIRELAIDSANQGIPLAFYVEQSPGTEVSTTVNTYPNGLELQRAESDGMRFFIGRDYERMEVQGNNNFRVELIERLLHDQSSESYYGTRDCSWESDRVETAPIFRVWESNTRPPLRERPICDCTHAQYGLGYMLRRWVILENRDLPDCLRVETSHWEGNGEINNICHDNLDSIGSEESEIDVCDLLRVTVRE